MCDCYLNLKVLVTGFLLQCLAEAKNPLVALLILTENKCVSLGIKKKYFKDFTVGFVLFIYFL